MHMEPPKVRSTPIRKMKMPRDSLNHSHTQLTGQSWASGSNWRMLKKIIGEKQVFKSPCWHLMAGTHQTTFIPKFKGIKTTLRLWRHSGPQAPHIISALLRSPSPPVLTDHPTSLTVQTPRPSPFSANAITFFKPLFLRLRNKDPRLSHQKSQATGPKSYSPEVAKLGLDPMTCNLWSSILYHLHTTGFHVMSLLSDQHQETEK